MSTLTTHNGFALTTQRTMDFMHKLLQHKTFRARKKSLSFARKKKELLPLTIYRMLNLNGQNFIISVFEMFDGFACDIFHYIELIGARVYLLFLSILTRCYCINLCSNYPAKHFTAES